MWRQDILLNTVGFVLGSSGAKSLKNRFENMAKDAEEENRKRADEERTRRQAREKKEQEKQKKDEEVK